MSLQGSSPDLVAEALARGASELSAKRRRIYHEKTAAQVRTIDGLIDVLWYQGRLREHYSLFMNIVSILFFNFNLNHLHTRFTPRTRVGLRALRLLHAGIDRRAPGTAGSRSSRAGAGGGTPTSCRRPRSS
jgi:hypothetical protein